ncbi:molybdate transport system substrate-binding protein [Neobacillus niacini]|uniref:molybdate ABC transporter substrate-binding protein n=1 Tax=Neobacillus niacini TaxID=86668 RepID=UPI002788633E|nr:molybdate ABC transporter substrate-binding protein [Neobacillus niacini]MDQ1005186.1 molybdate transport system substrate-binding protein [Neobacillus niacini]
MKKLYHLFSSIMLLMIVTTGCSINEQGKNPEEQNNDSSNQEVELTVSAAASLQRALNDIKTTFEKEYPHIKVVYNFGSSGALKQQISQGAPVDLFFSAAEDKFDQLVQEGLIEKEKSIDLVGNEIVLVVPKYSDKVIKTFENITKVKRFSIGTPESVPVGKYAKQTLEDLNVWKAVKGKIVYAKDVRQVLTYVETENVDARIVYMTDALISQKIEAVATAKKNTHEPIIYPVGVIKNSIHQEEAQLFYDYLQNEKSMENFEKFGFKCLN